MRTLYRDYGQDGRADDLGAPASTLFAPRLLELIRAEQRASVGETGRLGEDPLCDCQDDDGFLLKRIAIDQRAAGRSRAVQDR